MTISMNQHGFFFCFIKHYNRHRFTHSQYNDVFTFCWPLVTIYNYVSSAILYSSNIYIFNWFQLLLNCNGAD